MLRQEGILSKEYFVFCVIEKNDQQHLHFSLVEGGVEAEAKKALDNMGFILEAAGATFKNGWFS